MKLNPLISILLCEPDRCSFLSLCLGVVDVFPSHVLVVGWVAFLVRVVFWLLFAWDKCIFPHAAYVGVCWFAWDEYGEVC